MSLTRSKTPTTSASDSGEARPSLNQTQGIARPSLVPVQTLPVCVENINHNFLPLGDQSHSLLLCRELLST